MSTRFRFFKASFPFTKVTHRKNQKPQRPLRYEQLEPRRLLAATDLGAIDGRVFVDLDASGGFNSGEQVVGAAVQLFLDDGLTPGVFDTGDTEQGALGSPDTTDANGLYRFDGLGSGNYFVVQPLQMVGPRTLNLEVRGPIAVSGVGVAGTTTIDTFATNQTLIEDLVVDASSVSAFHDVGAEVLGTERDVEVNLQTAGAAGARVLSNELLFGLSGGAAADFSVVYDGNDGSTTVNTSGLSTDLTDGGTNTHFTVTINSQVPSDNATITVQNATMTATETFALSAGETAYCLAFADFTGDTDVFQNVGAITLAIDGNITDNDFEVSSFATLQPDVETQDFLNNGVADLRLTKTVDNSSPILGQNVTFTITLTNDGLDGATNVLVRDQLPAGLTYVSDNPSQGTYDDTLGIWDVGNLGNTGIATLEIVATVNSTGGITNIAQVSASDQDDTDSTPDNNEGSEDDQDEATLMAPVADLRLTKTVDNATPNVGDNVTFTVSVTNDGPNSATSVEVRDLLPTGLMYVSDNPSQGTYDDGTGIWTIGNMFSGDTDTLDITATVTSASAIDNIAQVSNVDQSDTDSTPDNNVPGEDDQDNATVTPQQADLRLNKTVNNNSPNVNDNVIFTITVTNDGPDGATNVQVSDQLPMGLSFVNDTPGQGTYDNGTGIWSVGNILNGNSATLDIEATVTSTAGITNVAPVRASDQFDPDSSPNNDQLSEDDQDDETLAAQQADLRLSKTVNNNSPNLNQNVIFTITVTNDGPNTATNVQVRDQLPAGLSFVMDTPSQGTYDNGTGIWSVGTITNGTGATLDIEATVSNAAGITNVAQVTASDQFDPDSSPNNDQLSEDDQDDETLTAQQADLRLSKTVNNNSPNLNQNVIFTITVTNDGPNTATNVQVRDQLPAGLSFVMDTPSQGTYDNGTGIWSVGTITNGTGATLDIEATVTSATGITNVAQVSASDQFDPDSTPDNDQLAEDDQDDETLTAQQADLRLSKSVNDNTPNVNQNVIFTVTVTNDGPNTATNVQVRDQLPAGLSLVNDMPSQGTYDNGTGIWSVGTITDSSSATLTIEATVTSAVGITNVAQVSASDQFDPDSTPDNNQLAEDDQDDETLSPQQADLRLNKSVDNATPNIGENVTFTVSVTNDGPSTATSVQVRDQLPAGLTYFSDLPSQGSYDPGTGIWNIGPMLNGVTETLQLTATVQNTAGITNTAQVSNSDQFDPDSTPNNDQTTEDDQDDANLTAQQADLRLAKTVNNNTPNIDDNVTFTITVTNDGPDDAMNVRVRDQLPAGLSFVMDTPSQGTYNDGTGIWDIGQINNGQSVTLDIVATVTSAAGITNTAQVTSSDQFDPDSEPNNDQPSEDDQDDESLAAQQADLRLTKTVDDNSPNLGQTVTFTVTATNDGPNNATNVQVRDQLPTGLTFFNDTPSQGTYDNATGIWNVGTIANGNSATLNIQATVSTTNGITNVAQVSAADQFDPDSTPDNSEPAEDDQDNAFLIAQEADLRVIKSVDNSNPNFGENVVFTVTIVNDGPNTATNVELADALPSGLSFALSNASQGSYDSLTGIWSVGDLLNGQSETLNITATVNTADAVTNSAEVRASDQFDPDSTPDNNNPVEDDQDNASLDAQTADLSVTKTVNDDNPEIGENVVYTISVENNGPNTASNVQVEDLLPSGTSFVLSSTSQGGYDSATGIWSVGTLANGATATLQITAQVTTRGTKINTAQVAAADQADPDSTPGNSVASEDDQDSTSLTPVALSAITGRVFFDADNDGFFDAGEKPIPGVTVELKDLSGIVERFVETGADGRYEFENLVAGSYFVEQKQPSPFLDGREQLGSDGLGSIGDNDQFFFVLGVGEAAEGYNFGEAAINATKRRYFASTAGNNLDDEL